LICIEHALFTSANVPNECVCAWNLRKLIARSKCKLSALVHLIKQQIFVPISALPQASM
jgi:hypothetical protein